MFGYYCVVVAVCFLFALLFIIGSLLVALCLLLNSVVVFVGCFVFVA